MAQLTASGSGGGVSAFRQDNAHARAVAALAAELKADLKAGLGAGEAAVRRRRLGANRLKAAAKIRLLELLWRQIANPIMALLLAAVGIAGVFGDVLEAMAISAVIVLNVALGFGMELRASRAIAALKALGGAVARVVRDGRQMTLPVEELTLGDLVVLEAGDLVPADLRVVAAAQLEADESALTGESLPVAKAPEAVAADTPMAERASMLYRGTAVIAGGGRGLVVAIGQATEVGRISALVAAAEEQRTPLEVRLSRLGLRLLWLTLIIAFAIAAIGMSVGQPPYVMAETAIALAVAAIPEGLPVVAALTLARGVLRMARLNALVRRLAAVEALGATTVILTDKTGTLTENRMTATTVVTADGRVELTAQATLDAIPRELLHVAALCCNASLASDGGGIGDPMEVAILRAAADAGFVKAALEAARPRHREEAFSPLTKMMATVHHDGAGGLVAVKGAPEAVIIHAEAVATAEGTRPLDDAARHRWLAENNVLARAGLRVLAIARRAVAGGHDGSVYDNLELLGLIGFFDPPRRDVAAAIGECRAAGLKVVMVTGDQAGTAETVARAVGIDVTGGVATGSDFQKDLKSPQARERLRQVTVFARVTPEDKFALVDFFQESGEVVAMTGDGVNDAPALKKADVGVAMGQRGTEVAREAADMVLRDDAFATIVTAVREGRVIFGNIRQSARYLLACNLSEVLVVGLAVISGLPLPLTALQILFLNLVTDVLPAVAIGAGEGAAGVMRQPPREKREDILAARHWRWIVAQALVLTAATLGAFSVVLWQGSGDVAEAVTVAFLSLAVGQLVTVFATRSRDAKPFDNEIIRNPYVWAAIVLCGGVLVAACGLPILRQVLSLHPLDGSSLMIIAAAGLAPLVFHEISEFLRRYKFRAVPPSRRQ